MAFSLTDFKSRGLVYGGARPSLFDIQLTVPTGIQLNNQAVQKLTFNATAASLPASTVGSIDVPYFGRKIKVAGDRTFTDWTVTIMNDEDFAVRAMMEQWSNALNQMVANIRPDDTDADYKAVLTVNQYGKNGGGGGQNVVRPIRSYSIIGAFPTSIDAINLNWNTTNQIEEYTVTFAYDYWVPVVEQSGKPVSIDSPYSTDGASVSS